MMQEYWELLLHWLRTSGIKVVAIAVVAYIVIRIIFRLIGRIRLLADDGDNAFTSEREKRAATLYVVLRQVTGIGISGIAFMMILREFRIDIAPIIAGAGIVGLAIGFGAQSLVKDVISGFFILMENHYDVGDVISGAGVSGAVEKISLRVTQLRDLEGRVHFIPNGEFRVISNLTRGWSRAVIDVGVSYAEDLERVQKVMLEVAEGLRVDPVLGAAMIEPMEILGLEAFDESAIRIRALLKTLPGRQWPLAREYRKRLKRRFDELGISIPFPHRVLVPGPGTDLSQLEGPGRRREGALAASVPAAPGTSLSSRLPD